MHDKEGKEQMLPQQRSWSSSKFLSNNERIHTSLCPFLSSGHTLSLSAVSRPVEPLSGMKPEMNEWKNL